jgi:GDA1/CD39 (nucleoside phosphatase) family
MRTWNRSCFFLALLFTLSLHAEPKSIDICQKKHCEIIIDAGSSGTRFYLYALNLKNFSETYDLTLIDKKAIDQPLGDYNDEKLFILFDELLGDYKSQPIQVYMYATEGLRKLSLKERRKRFALAKKWFETKSKLIPKEIRTLGGDEEAVLLWLANAVELAQNHDNSSIDGSAVIEIGGGSAQIALAIKHNNFATNHHVYPIHFHGQIMNIWCMSFPNLGINNMKASYEENQNCYPKNYPMTNHKLGNGAIKGCISGIKQYKQTHGLSTKEEVVTARNILQKESKNYQWYGFGVPDYMGKSPILNFGHEYYSLNELQDRANQKACTVDWSLQEKEFSKVKFKEKVCFSSAYIAWFAEDLLNLPSSTTINYHQTDISLGWSKGSVIKRHTVV